MDPNPFKKSFPIGYYGLPVLWAFGVGALAYMSRSSTLAMRQFLRYAVRSTCAGTALSN